MINNLFIGKNSFICKSIAPSIHGEYISHKEIQDVDFNDFDNIFFFFLPDNYKKIKIKNFLFE